MFRTLTDRRAGHGSRWFLGIAALMLLASPVPPPLSGASVDPGAAAPAAEPARAEIVEAAPATSRIVETAEVVARERASSASPTASTARPTGQPALRRASASSFEVNGILELDAPIDYGDYAWNDAGVPAGPVTIVVDLRAQRLYAYRGGIEIGRSSILYGADDKPTPTGVFPILQKRRHHISNLYGAPMPYMMRLTMDGVAIHASDVEEGFATHGCVGVPMEFAALLFAEAKLGDKVLVTNAWKPEIYWTKGAWADDDTV